MLIFNSILNGHFITNAKSNYKDFQMFKKFTWNENITQSYTSEYGSQFNNIDTTDNINKADGTTFAMNAGIHQYVIKPSGKIPAIFWGDSSVIQVTSGRFVLDFSRAAASSAVINASSIKIGGTKNFNATLEIQGCLDFLTNGSVGIASNGLLNVNSLQNHFRFGDTHQSVKLENNARLSVSTISSPESNGNIHGPFELNDESSAEIRVSSLNHDKNAIYSVKDGAELLIQTDKIEITTQSLIFNLYGGKPQVSILGFTSKYCDITSFGIKKSTHLPGACFNFITTDGKNEGEVLLSCSYNSDGDIFTDPGIIMFWIKANKIVYINGAPADTDKINFNYDNDFLVISLKE